MRSLWGWGTAWEAQHTSERALTARRVTMGAGREQVRFSGFILTHKAG